MSASLDRHRLDSVRRHVALRSLVAGVSIVGAWSAVPAQGRVPARTPSLDQVQVVTESRSRRSVAEETFARLVTVQLQHVPLPRALREIAASAGVQIQYQTELLDPITADVSLSASKLPLGIALDRVLMGTRLRAISSLPNIVTIKEDAVPAQGAGTILGVVRHAKTRQPIAGATIVLDDTGRSVISGEDGTFRLSASVGEHILHARGVGYVRQSKHVTTTANQTTSVELLLEPSANVLDQVVVTGTVAATERRALTNPITVITAEEIEKRGITRIEQLLRGEVPGVIALEKGDQAYAGTINSGSLTMGSMTTSQVYSRGSSSVSGTGMALSIFEGKGNPLKTYVDGVELLDASYLGTIDPRNIERIEIITGPQAATIYGSGAMGGVMHIFTKKGIGQTAPEATLSLKYGVLENSVSRSLTPTHNHALTVTGGTGPEFSYSATGSYDYTGQWQPALFSQTYAISAGISHTRGAFTGSGSASVNNGRNGSWPYGFSPYYLGKAADGEMRPSNLASYFSQRISTSASQSMSVSLDYRTNAIMQHHLSAGVTRVNFANLPSAPVLATPADTLYLRGNAFGTRTSASYNVTLAPGALGFIAPTLILGVTGSNGEQTQVEGCVVAPSATSLVTCSRPLSVTQTLKDNSTGGFGKAKIAFWDRFYIDLGLRGEHNPTYGRDHKIDWTPSQGASYVLEYGDLTVKALASYGRTTRPPNDDMRRETLRGFVGYLPGQFIGRFANPDLTPEYSRGPEGGLEVYFGNRFSVTVNHYQQKITDLIQLVDVDSLFLTDQNNPAGSFWIGQSMYVNAASIQQKGWEGTGSLFFGPLSVKGTYSWNDSRILSVHPKFRGAVGYYGLGTFYGIPTHSGNVTATYARGATSVTLTSNYIGSAPQANGYFLDRLGSNDRLTMYSLRRSIGTLPWTQPGYIKSDLAVLQRVTSRASFTLNVTNLGNSYASDLSPENPSIGRKTAFGVSIRTGH